MNQSLEMNGACMYLKIIKHLKQKFNTFCDLIKHINVYEVTVTSVSCNRVV